MAPLSKNRRGAAAKTAGHGLLCGKNGSSMWGMIGSCTSDKRGRKTCVQAGCKSPEQQSGQFTKPAAPNLGDTEAVGESAQAEVNEPDPAEEDKHAADELAVGVGGALKHMAALGGGPEKLTCFHSKVAPSMLISDYFARIHSCMNCSMECYLVCLIYIDRLVKLHPEIVFSPLSCHRMTITSMTVAAKFHDDVFYSNKFYAKVGGVSLKELNRLEVKFVQLLDWKLSVSEQEFSMYSDMVSKALRGASPEACQTQPRSDTH